MQPALAVVTIDALRLRKIFCATRQSLFGSQQCFIKRQQTPFYASPTRTQKAEVAGLSLSTPRKSTVKVQMSFDCLILHISLHNTAIYDIYMGCINVSKWGLVAQAQSCAKETLKFYGLLTLFTNACKGVILRKSGHQIPFQ
jgi:hypothetical protein